MKTYEILSITFKLFGYLRFSFGIHWENPIKDKPQQQKPQQNNQQQTHKGQKPKPQTDFLLES